MELTNLEIAGWGATPEQLQAAAAITIGIFGAIVVILIIRRATKLLTITLIGVVIIVGWWGVRNGLLTSFLDANPH
ncbi:MAG: hypothetical protein CK552_00340 [Actinobacteria bacterium]|nr:MAG: hypothetical protein CK552_00340 [Actinomycetota bacterium]